MLKYIFSGYAGEENKMIKRIVKSDLSEREKIYIFHAFLEGRDKSKKVSLKLQFAKYCSQPLGSLFFSKYSQTGMGPKYHRALGSGSSSSSTTQLEEIQSYPKQ